MNTILITGTAKATPDNKVHYDVFLWASKEGDQIQLITTLDLTVTDYDSLWVIAKDHAENYFDSRIFQDGAYTQFLNHITVKYQ